MSELIQCLDKILIDQNNKIKILTLSLVPHQQWHMFSQELKCFWYRMLLILWSSHFMVFSIHLEPYVSSDLKVRWNEMN